MKRNTDTYLSEDEIADLTGRVYPKAQARVLAERGWTFQLDGDGKPLVLRAYHDQRMGLDRRGEARRRPHLANLARRAA